MPATPKALRQPPPRRFENYILTRSTATSVNLANVHDGLFSRCSPASPLETTGGDRDPGRGYSDDGISVPLDIGFDFQIDNVVYKKFVACANGWMALVDPTTGTFVSSEVLSSQVWLNAAISTSFSSQAVLIAPWFDDLRNVAENTTQYVASSSLSSAKVDRINKGLEPAVTFINASQNSVKFFRDVRSSSGRRLIVRWNSLSDFSNPSTILRFEAILYENGKIEFRYSPRQNINITYNIFSPEDATIGIFMPNGVNRFRDFSYGLGYRDTERQQYRYGAAVYTSTYTDTDGESLTSNYTCNLKPFTHWPGLGSAGSMFTFSPPTNRRKILPRNELRRLDNRLVMPTVARTGDTRLGNDAISFDDRRTLTYITSSLVNNMTVGVLVNAPSMMQRFYGDSEPTSVTRQDLFAGDFEFTASIAQSVVEQFIQGDVLRPIEPFSEYKLFENDPAATTDAFYVSGSSIDSLGSGLTQPLKAKTQLRISLPINNNIQLMGTASTIHYYNTRFNAWEVPQNSSYIIGNNATSNNSGVPKGDIVFNRELDASSGRIIEDHKGFGPIGNVIASGSRDKSGSGIQTDDSIGSAYSTANVTTALNKSYAKSISTNNDYKATTDEVIKLPINHPFLIERAVIEIPFAAGDGWFADRTSCLATLENTAAGGFDFGGPALTVALFNQVTIGDSTRRDLIMSGVITHSNDNVNHIVFSAFPPITSTYQIRPRGYLSFGGTPSAVVTPVLSGAVRTFTGSVVVKCEAQVSNGVIVKLELAMTSSDIQANKSGVIDVFNAPLLTLGSKITNHYSQSCYIAYIDNFGRGGTGFDPSGRSVFGKEFTTSQDVNKQGKVVNPFYLTGTRGGAASPTFNGIPTQFVNGITNGNTFKFEVALPLQNSLPSPYLVFPNDTLVLAISKSRPVFYGSQTPSPYTSGSISHDVQLITGAINVVLYGSLLRENKEFHDTLNQPLASEALHEIVVGNEPVLDQFDIAYRDQYTGGIYDNFVTGSLITRVIRSRGRVLVITGSRGSVFSKNNARFQPPPATTGAEAITNPSKNFRLQPWWERCGTPRVMSHFDSSERYWDSLMPGIADAFACDDSLLFKQVSVTISPFLTANMDVKNVAFLFLDGTIFEITTDAEINRRVVNLNWSRAFPFEPRYSGVVRQKTIQSSYIASAKYDSNVDFNNFFPIEPTKCSSLIVGYNSQITANDFSFSERNWFLDANVSTGMSSSMSNDDTSRVLYGFGDLNTLDPNAGAGLYGSNHYPEGRHSTYGSVIQYHFAPVIRGWKYGVYSGLPTFTNAYFRKDRFGQFRDMLEQRQQTKFYMSSEKSPDIANFKDGVGVAAVTIKFVDAAGKLTKPENTWSQNLSLEATSSVPYFDGETRNRNDINKDTLNANIITFKSNQFGQVTL